ncbi:MAG: hypothetical protein ACON42_09275 [Flavobacteriaceae bacterium]
MKKLIFGSLAFVFLVATSYFWYLNTYHWCIQEDGPVEHLTAAALFLISCFDGVKALLEFKQHVKPQIFWLLISACSFIGFGEEISWGQRLFDFQSSPFSLQQNSEHEIDLHKFNWGNRSVNQFFSPVLYLGLAIYFFLLPVGVGRILFLEKWTSRWAIPLPSAVHAVVFLITTSLVLLIPDPNKWELGEAFVVLILFWIILNYRSEQRIYGK